MGLGSLNFEGVICFLKLHGPSMLTNMLISVSALLSIQLISVLRKHLVICQFKFSLLFIGHHQSAKLV